MMDYHARFYSPYLNRWTQPDSIIPDLTNPQSLNRYTYNYNNPVNFVDPTGHIPILDEDQIVLDELRELRKDYIAEQIRKRDECTLDNLAACWENRNDLYDFQDGDVVEDEVFIDMLIAIYNEYETKLFTGWGYRFGSTDTPFWNGTWHNNDWEYFPDYDATVKVWGGEYKQSDVNYVAQGMYSAMKGHDLNQAFVTAGKWKAGKHMSSRKALALSDRVALGYLHDDTEYWIKTGYNFYFFLKQKEQEGLLPKP